MKYSGMHADNGRRVVVCHGLGCFIFYSICAELWNRATGVGEDEEGGALKILL